jgi:hypothetical protein
MSVTARQLIVPLQNGGGGGELNVAFAFIALAVAVVVIAGMWKTFQKAGQPGWAAIIPIYNFYIMLKIGENAWWWVLIILFVPLVNIYGTYRMYAGVSEAFSRGIAFTLGLWFLPFIFFPLLGFGDYEHRGVLR